MMEQHLALLLVLVLFQAASGNDIFVVPEGGSNNSTCWKGGRDEPCGSLALGLEGLQYFNHTTVWVAAGAYSLNGSTDHKFNWMVNIAIVADQHDLDDGATPVSVECEKSAGLTFIYSTNITIRGIQFIGCGAYHNSTSRNSTESQFEGLHTALYFLYTSDLTLEYVSVTETIGTGMVVYASTGHNHIAHCAFTLNSPLANESGGGGLYIEFSYCAPTLSGDMPNCNTSNVPLQYITGSLFTIDTCVFHNNSAQVEDEIESTFILPQLATHLAFGRGGGLSVFFKGKSKDNVVSVYNSTFSNNTALWGAGVFVEYQDMTTNNTFDMQSSIITGNECFHSSSENKGTGGGGARVGHIFFNETHTSLNHMTFNNVMFSHNKAYFGGGLSFYTAKEPTEPSSTNTLEFYNCNWVSNIARVGSGVDLSVWHPVPYGATVSPTFTDCKFSENTANYTSLLGSFEGIGAFYSDSIPVDFVRSILFESNFQSALACTGARIRFLHGCDADFRGNTGRHGGAVALLGSSFLEVSQGTVLTFTGNVADFKGGAIFGQSIGEHDLISSRNCFIRYDDIRVTPYNWSATFNFANNSANDKANSIYATSLLPCLWGGAYGSTQHGAEDVFCWNGEDDPEEHKRWNYFGKDCSDEIATAPAEFRNSTFNKSIEIIPGMNTVLPFYTVDDRGRNNTAAAILTAKVVHGSSEEPRDVFIATRSLYISDNSIELHGVPNSSASIRLETIDPRVITIELDVQLTYCPPGMIPVSDGGKKDFKCHCRGNYGGMLHCNQTYFYSELLRGSWIGSKGNKSQYLVGQCPYCSTLTNDKTLTLPRKREDICRRMNRTGPLCGRCIESYGPIVNGYSFECHYCPASHAAYNWIFYLMTEFLPVTIFFFIVVFFNISATSGPANAFVFFAQILTAVFNIDGDGAVQMNDITHASGTLSSLYTIPYDIWNQNFFHPLLPSFCLSSQITTLQLLTTGYITAFYPLFLVIIFSLFVWAYSSGVNVIVFMCRPVHRCFARFRGLWDLQRSIVHALATFILLSYTKFTLVSFIILTDTPLVDDSGDPIHNVLYFDGSIDFLGPEHIPYLIVAISVLVTFVAIPPILLAAPSVIHLVKKLYRKVRHKELDLPACFNPGPRMDQFLQAFHGCYKDGTGGKGNNIDCRWFASFYFILRLTLFLVYAFTPDWFLQFVAQQLVCIIALVTFVIFRPYKNEFFNIVDICIFANMAAITTFAMFNYYLTIINVPLSRWAYGLQYILIFLPLIYMITYVVVFMWRKYSKHVCISKKGQPLLMPIQQTDEEDDVFLQYADEEERYRNICGSYESRRSPSLIATQVDSHHSPAASTASEGSVGTDKSKYGATKETQFNQKSSDSSATGPLYVENQNSQCNHAKYKTN